MDSVWILDDNTYLADLLTSKMHSSYRDITEEYSSTNPPTIHHERTYPKIQVSKNVFYYAVADVIYILKDNNKLVLKLDLPNQNTFSIVSMSCDNRYIVVIVIGALKHNWLKTYHIDVCNIENKLVCNVVNIYNLDRISIQHGINNRQFKSKDEILEYASKHFLISTELLPYAKIELMTNDIFIFEYKEETLMVNIFGAVSYIKNSINPSFKIFDNNIYYISAYDGYFIIYRLDKYGQEIASVKIIDDCDEDNLFTITTDGSHIIVITREQKIYAVF